MQYRTESRVQAAVASQRQANAIGGASLPAVVFKMPNGSGGKGNGNGGGSSGGGNGGSSATDISTLLLVFRCGF
jgi:hypothetical protein